MPPEFFGDRRGDPVSPEKYGQFSPTLKNVRNGVRLSYLRSKEVALLNPDVDLMWGRFPGRDPVPSSYFDYYFTGQDMQVYIDGTEGSGERQADLPIMQFAWSISQQKQPLYGFWSYKYDAMMRGTRLVNGVMRIATTDTGYMTRMLSHAARNRVEGHSEYPVRGLDSDEENIEKYWGRHVDGLDQNTVKYIDGGKHLFNSHPPFNMIIVHGVQSTGIARSPDQRVSEVYEKYQGDTPLMTDTNERLVEADNSGYSMRWVLDTIEIVSLQVEYSPDGQVCSEVYSFIGRDAYSPTS